MKDYIGSIVDLTGDAYLNPGWPGHGRSEGQITSIAVHHDASIRQHDYDSVARYRSEAALHYQNLGPGLQYHYKIDNTGVIFRIRPHSTWLHHCGQADGNVNGIAICLDGYFHAPHNQVPTREQYEALKQLLDWLSTQNPQFPADQNDVYPHRHYSATACCGDLLVPFIEDYRNRGGDITIPDVPYDWPEFQPAITPTPTPPATPAESHVDELYRVFIDSKQVGAYKVLENAIRKAKEAGGQIRLNGTVVEIPADGPVVSAPDPTPVTPLPPSQPEIITEPTKPVEQPHTPAEGANNMDQIKEKVLSRKFLVAVVSVAYFFLNGDTNQALAVALAYLGVQGVIDHKSVQ